MSRFDGGIHFMSANRDGKACGAQIANYVIENYLLPNSMLPQVRLAGTSEGRAWVQLQGLINHQYVVEATADFMRWLPIYTNAAASGGNLLADPALANLPLRFYRAVEHWTVPRKSGCKD